MFTHETQRPEGDESRTTTVDEPRTTAVDGSRTTTVLLRETAREATVDALSDHYGDVEWIADRGEDARWSRPDQESDQSRSSNGSNDGGSSGESGGFVSRHPGVAGIVAVLGLAVATALVRRRRRSARDDGFDDAHDDDRGMGATVPIEDDGGSGPFADGTPPGSSTNEVSDDTPASKGNGADYGTETGTDESGAGADESGTGTDEA